MPEAIMTPEVAALICEQAGITGKSAEALILVYAQGLSAYAAAQSLGVSQGMLSRARSRFVATVERHNRLPYPIKLGA